MGLEEINGGSSTSVGLAKGVQHLGRRVGVNGMCITMETDTIACINLAIWNDFSGINASRIWWKCCEGTN
jgi:hypothetical protein